jgi:hypothetical protein
MNIPHAYIQHARLGVADGKHSARTTRKPQEEMLCTRGDLITAHSTFPRLKLLWSYDISIPTLKTGNISSFQTRDRVETVTVNGPFACREGKCNGKRCSAFETKNRCEAFVTRWTLISSSSSHGGYKTAATHRCPCCISRQQTHARQTAGS